MTAPLKRVYFEGLDSVRLELWLWAWMGLSSIAAGVLAGNVFAHQEAGFAGDESHFNGAAFFGGLVGGAIANIPVMVLFYLGVRLLQTQLAIKSLLRAEFDDLERS